MTNILGNIHTIFVFEFLSFLFILFKKTLYS